ncbi:MAG: DUF2147 domain-containing protein [Pseudomonadota bacterium]
MPKGGLLVLLMLFASSTAHADTHDVFGTYLTEEQNSHVQIKECDDGSPCGVIVWLNPEMLDEGVTQETAKTKAGEPVLGLTMLKGFARKKSDWRGGTIYHPGRDKTYASRLSRMENGDLEVKGCIAFICQTQIWTPVAAD